VEAQRVNVWAIADLHLSLARPDRRERYAERWRDHAEAIARNWREIVRPEDLVLLPGDVSMARNHRDLQPDLEWLGSLPGTKVLARGNHDAWWNHTEAVRRLLRRSMIAVGGDAAQTHGVVVCGSLGTPALPDDPTPEQQVAFDAEMIALDDALDSAARLRTGGEPLIVLWHYPPFDQHRRSGPCVDRFENAGVTACVYGHLHIQGQWSLAVQGCVGTVRYYCVAADAIGFRPLRIPTSPCHEGGAQR
jgi:predicted phosphohydrolase